MGQAFFDSFAQSWTMPSIFGRFERGFLYWDLFQCILVAFYGIFSVNKCYIFLFRVRCLLGTRNLVIFPLSSGLRLASLLTLNLTLSSLFLFLSYLITLIT